MKVIILLAAIACMAVGAVAQYDKVVCYHGTWAAYRPGDGKFVVEDINPNLCTHLIYTFVGLSASDGAIRILDSWQDIDLGGYNRSIALKKINPNLKVIIAIGGWNEGSLKYSQVATSDSLRAKFAQNAYNFVTKYGFDGFDLDWEYPALRGGAETDYVNYIKMLKEVSALLKPAGLLLTAAVAAPNSYIQSSFNVPEMSKYLDIINVMTYDLHGAWDKVTGANSPLYKSSIDVTFEQQQLNVETCINAWLTAGAPPHKVVVGLPLYGHTFTLSSADASLGAPISGPGTAGQWTREPGMMGYNEICLLHKAGDWKITWDDEQKVPFMVKGNQWVSYDDVESISIKTKWGKDRGIGGAMVWSVETDDFRGTCNSGKYPLLTAIHNIVFGGGSSTSSPSTTTPSTTTGITHSTTTGITHSTTTGIPPTSTTVTSSTGFPGEFVCPDTGFFRDPDACHVFYNCVLQGNVLKPHRFECKNGLMFNTLLNACDYAHNVDCSL